MNPLIIRPRIWNYTPSERVNSLTIKPAFFKCDVSSWNGTCCGPESALAVLGLHQLHLFNPTSAWGQPTYFPGTQGASTLKAQCLSALWHPLQPAPTRPSVQKDTIGKPIPSACGQTAWNRALSWWVNAPQQAWGRTWECSSRPFSKIRPGAWDLKCFVSCRQVATSPDLQREEVISL